MKKYIPSVIILMVFLLIWELIARYIDAMYILPTPLKIIEKTWKLREVLITVHLKATLEVTIIGISIAIFMGGMLAVFMSLNKNIEKAIYPLDRKSVV